MADQYSPLVPDQTILNEVKFAARDFASMADDLLRRLKLEYGSVYNDYASTSQGIMLRDLVAWAYASLTWYLDRQASDTFLATARTRAAVERLVEQIAYKMRAAAASGGRLVLTFPNGSPAGFEMPERWRYPGPNGLQFESIAKVVVPAALSPGAQLNVDIRQGETRTVTYTSNGAKNQTYRLSAISVDRYLAKGEIEVWVDGLLWDEKDFLFFGLLLENNHYEVSYLANPPIIRFGDGQAGNVPPVGAEIKIRFVITDGANGNVKSNAIQDSLDRLVVGGEAVEFTVNNPERTSGGTEPEEAAEAKRWAPMSFAARGAAITRPDYEALSNSFSDVTYGAVAKAYAINPRSSYDDIVFNSFIADIRALLDVFNAEVSALEDNISTKETELTTLVADLSTALTSLDSYRETLYGWAADADAKMESARDQLVDAEARMSVVVDRSQTAMTETQALIDTINGGTIPPNIVDLLGSILVAGTAAHTEGQNAKASVQGASAALDLAASPMDNLVDGLVVDGTMDQLITAISAIATSISTVVGEISDYVEDIDGKGDTLATAIEGLLDDMRLRIGELFSDDCLSNYVQVPILATDLSGNYVAPSIGLRQALQAHLNEIKEVTQVVEVVDGSLSLVSADISIKLALVEAYSPSEVASQVRQTVIALLKGRDFNQPLYLSDLYDAVMESSPGIDYANITISPSNVDGNLIAEANNVIVMGTLTITDQNGGVL